MIHRIEIPQESLQRIAVPGELLGATVIAYGHDQAGCYIVLQDREIKKEIKVPVPFAPVITRWNREKIYEALVRVVKEKLGVYESKVLSTSNFVDDLGADSLDIVELVMAVEDEFNVEIPDEEAEKVKTVQDALCYLCGKLL